MATYNGSKYIDQSIHSVLSQSYKNWELIIINDASTDNVDSIIKNFMKIDKRIIYKKNKINLKLPTSLNIGIQISSGQYIARIDDDDIWSDPDKLKKQVDFLEKNSDHGLVGTNYTFIDEEGKYIDKTQLLEKNEDIKRKLLLGNRFGHSTVVIRRSILDKTGLYDKSCHGTEDYDLRLRIGKFSKLANLQVYYVKYRILTTSISNKMGLQQRYNAYIVAYKYRKFYASFYGYSLYNLLQRFLLRMIMCLTRIVKNFSNPFFPRGKKN